MWRINWGRGRVKSVWEEISEDVIVVVEVKDDGSLDKGGGSDGDGDKCVDLKDIMGV